MNYGSKFEVRGSMLDVSNFLIAHCKYRLPFAFCRFTFAFCPLPIT